MLKSLSIRNYALISQLEIDFSQGLSVITGETGAGKSIIVGALSLILGQRADAKMIKHNEDKCSIEGLFDISSYGLESFFTERNLEYDAQNCILRRDIWTSGKSRAFINDMPVNLMDLKDLGAFLIDIHSQHQNLLLGEDKFQLQVVDILANNKRLREEYKTEYRHFVSICKQVEELTKKVEEHTAEQDYLQFQLQQLTEAKLKPDEQFELEAELITLSNIEEVKTGIYALEHLLSADEKGIIDALQEASNVAQSIQKHYSPANEIFERLQTAYLDLQDLLLNIGNQQDELELDPRRLQWINERLDTLYSLQQKHKAHSIEGLIRLKNNLEEQLREIENYDTEVKQMQQQWEESKTMVEKLANALTKTRTKTAALLEKQLIRRVSSLGMPSMQFHCQISNKSEPDITGADLVTFLFSANKNVEVKPVSQIASGGEISRLMLGIKALIARITALPTIILDEIDTGVSGEVADKMGNIMHQMGEVMQVITITHLPQIAAWGDSHFFVYKKEDAKVTETHIRRLSEEERIQEIAHMLSGSELTEAAIENAKELLK
ncbi:DNA repair protein RecN [Bacteroidia bacterium]|nr:DNA repair protein RecN [Bacteroidia bacterium]GHT03306.1 DNA repair protein RecN [Bacteroidia bacterium]GHT45603.1 DNA repair protein RecN [Bacteroidia bacterium]